MHFWTIGAEHWRSGLCLPTAYAVAYATSDATSYATTYATSYAIAYVASYDIDYVTSYAIAYARAELTLGMVFRAAASGYNWPLMDVSTERMFFGNKGKLVNFQVRKQPALVPEVHVFAPRSVQLASR